MQHQVDPDPPLFPELLALDVRTFRDWTDDTRIRRGIRWYRDGRIRGIVEQSDGVDADFDDCATGKFAHGTVRVRLIDGTPDVDAVLGKPWELDKDCWSYAVATVLAYQAAQPDATTQALGGAADQARLDREKRARAEVVCEPLGHDGRYGPWRAASVAQNRPGRDGYVVHLRSIAHRLNGCTCPDFELSALGTCKHIEAVRAAATMRPPGRGPRAALVRNFDDRLRPIWGLVEPADGGLGAALGDEAGATIELDGATHDEPPLRFTAFNGFTAVETARRLATDPRVAVGADVVAALDQAATYSHGDARRARVRSELEDWDGRITGLRATLFPYQREGVAFLLRNGRAMLADDMGLGKTLQAVAAIAWLHDRGEIERALVICPTSLAHQWVAEIRRFTDLDAVVVQGSRADRVATLRSRRTVTISTYERVRLDFDIVADDLRPDLLVVDEAQRVKNWATLNAQHVAALDTRFSFVLTGTPLENRLEELYSLMQLVDPYTFGALWRFHREFCVLDLSGQVIGYRNLAELRRRIASTVLRRERREVLDDLPERTDAVITVPLEKAQRAVHDEAVDGAKRYAAIRKRRPLTPVERQRLLGCLQKARMACDSAALIDDRLPWRSPKLEALADMVGEICGAQGRKLVVFTEWIAMGEFVRRVVAEQGFDTVHLHGSVPSKKRPALVERFRDDPRCGVFVASDAGSTGLNLQFASALVHLDCPWNPAVLDQRTARIHRHGQTDKVDIIRLLSDHSYELRVAGLVEGKRDLFDAVVGSSEIDTLTPDTRGLERLLAALTEAEALTEQANASYADTTAEDANDRASDAGDANDMAGEQTPADENRRDGASEPTAISGDDESLDIALLDAAIAQLDPDNLDRRSKYETLLGLLRTVPPDAEVRIADRRVLVFVSEIETGLRYELEHDFEPLQVHVVEEEDRDAVLRLARAWQGGEPLRLEADPVQRQLDATPVAEPEIDHDPERIGADPEPMPGDDAGPDRGPSTGTGRSVRRDPRVGAAASLWDDGLGDIALRLRVDAGLDRIARAMGVRAPDPSDAWRWLYVDALPAGAVDVAEAGAIAAALGVASVDEPDESRIHEAWTALDACAVP